MNEHFIVGFQKEAGVIHSLGRASGAAEKLFGAAAKKGGEITRKIRAIPVYAKASWRAGSAGKKDVTFSQAESVVKKRDAFKRGLETKQKNAVINKAKQEKQLATNKKGAETKAANKAKAQAKVDAKDQAVKDKKKAFVKNVAKAVAIPTAVVGGTYVATEAIDASKKNNQSRYQYAQ